MGLKVPRNRKQLPGAMDTGESFIKSDNSDMGGTVHTVFNLAIDQSYP